MDLVDLVVAVHDQLDASGISHAFGGALALAYVAEPRGTVDIDVNVFIAPEAIGEVVEALEPLGFVPERAGAEAADPPIAGRRFVAPGHPFAVDIFPSLHDQYRSIEARREHYPFGRSDDVLPFLSAEDLCVFKLSFGRLKDWADLQAVAVSGRELDIGYIEEMVVILRGPSMYPRVARLRGLLRLP